MVFAGVFGKSGMQDVVFCAVSVVGLWQLLVSRWS